MSGGGTTILKKWKNSSLPPENTIVNGEIHIFIAFSFPNYDDFIPVFCDFCPIMHFKGQKPLNLSSCQRAQ